MPRRAALFATGAVAALALALTIALEKGWLTIALGLMVPGIAWVAEKRPLPALRVLAAVGGVLVLTRYAWEPRIAGDHVGSTPLFNWLLYGYGIPAAAFWLAGQIMRRRADDVPARMIDAGAILLTVLLVFLEIRHYVNDGDVYRRSTRLAEVAPQVCAGLAMTIGLERLRRRSHNIVHDIGALVIAALTFAAIVFRLGGSENPLFSGEPVGGRYINLVLLGYGLPAILAAVLALVSRGVRPQLYNATAAVTAVALTLAYLSLEVRTLYHGEVLNRGAVGDAEQYTYSAVWLTFGVALLVVGVGCARRHFGSRPPRWSFSPCSRYSSSTCATSPASTRACHSSGSASCCSASDGSTSACCPAALRCRRAAELMQSTRSACRPHWLGQSSRYYGSGTARPHYHR